MPADEFVEAEAPPLPRADRTQLFPHREWREAEAALAPDLAALAFDFGRLEERLRALGPGARHRLALQEVSSLGWWTGDRLPVDRLVLWVSQQIGATGPDAQALAHGGWAVRRLTTGRAPAGPVAMATLLGLPSAAGADRVQEACAVLDGLAGLHPVTMGAILFHLWRLVGAGPARDIEAAVLAARLAGVAAGQGAFLPLALAGFGGLAARGTAEHRLAAWIAGAHQALLAALLHLDRLARWSGRAAAAIADLSGRTPPHLLRLLADWPGVSAPMAESVTGASRAAVQRNLDLFSQRGLVRELTGQGRYRVWMAAL